MSTRLWTTERGVLWGIELTDLPPRVTPRLDARFKPVGPEATSALAQAMGVDHEMMRQRLALGKRCFAAWFQAAIVAYGWVSQREEYIGEQEREIRLESNEAYIWDCATLPPYRGEHLYSALLSYTLHTLRAEGVRHVWIGTSTSNRASLRGFAHAGFRPVVTLTYARFLDLRVRWMSDQVGAPKEMIAGARRALLCPDERMWGPLVISWVSSTSVTGCA